jgi:hypothetical protein
MIDSDKLRRLYRSSVHGETYRGDRDEIQKQVREYLKKGGKITKIPAGASAVISSGGKYTGPGSLSDEYRMRGAKHRMKK